jgi:hypothetical protein
MNYAACILFQHIEVNKVNIRFLLIIFKQGVGNFKFIVSQLMGQSRLETDRGTKGRRNIPVNVRFLLTIIKQGVGNLVQCIAVNIRFLVIFK